MTVINDRLIVALDVPTISEAKKLVESIGDAATFYKVGLELMMGGDYFELVRWLKNNGKKVFADLKLYDISETVGRSVANLAQYDIDLLTIHVSSRSIMEKAVKNKGNMRIIGVTVLTSIDRKDLREMGYSPAISVEELVEKKTEMALEVGLDGVVSSALEAQNLRQKFGKNFLIVSPGIRLEPIADDDQKRIADVKNALTNGSSHLVVGRPIIREADPRIAAQKFNQLIFEYL